MKAVFTKENNLNVAGGEIGTKKQQEVKGKVEVFLTKPKKKKN